MKKKLLVFLFCLTLCSGCVHSKKAIVQEGQWIEAGEDLTFFKSSDGQVFYVVPNRERGDSNGSNE